MPARGPHEARTGVVPVAGRSIERVAKFYLNDFIDLRDSLPRARSVGCGPGERAAAHRDIDVTIPRASHSIVIEHGNATDTCAMVSA